MFKKMTNPGPSVFIDLSTEEQASELRVYLNSLGADISIEKSPNGIEEDLHKIISVSDTCFKGSESDIECVLNSIVSLLVLTPLESPENLTLAFCEKLSKVDEQSLGEISLKVLWLLFQSLDEKSQTRYHVYYHLVQVAKQIDQIKAVFSGVDELEKQFKGCPPSIDQMQKLLRLLHEALSKESELAAKVMMALLGTYTTETASDARDDAQRCIAAALADPNTFLLDPLLALKPVKCLEGELIHDLLTVFVSEKLSVYIKFYEGHKEFVHSIGLNHEDNMKKMRLLTFMQLGESSPELSFKTIVDELIIPEEEVEAFVIDVLKTKLVRARMDRAARKVHVSSTMHRTFGPEQWESLRDTLRSWKSNLAQVQYSMGAVLNRAYQG